MIPKYRTFGDQYKYIHKILIREAAMCNVHSLWSRSESDSSDCDDKCVYARSLILRPIFLIDTNHLHLKLYEDAHLFHWMDGHLNMPQDHILTATSVSSQ